ncbi:uncharacterized protein LOC113390772 [Ctenocephalides felis]|uniref:uncharacterized protein LOC113390772 n=1 Tax=Ctenocephalides felis TaxID=7515 RepID=UPI000E6E3891|nr:uncharacterized protein LOC113390772 [Ctenocephalides felis]
MVSPLSRRQDTIMRKAISPHEKLTATLRFLASGRSYEDLKFTTLISPQALGVIIPETCEAISKVLEKNYFKSEVIIQPGLYQTLIRAIDGKHIDIIPPSGSGSYYYNYECPHSMVLLAIVNAKHQFIVCDFGVKGGISDRGILQTTELYDKLQKNELEIPSHEPIKNSSEILPYVFIADDAFALRTHMMKPFRHSDLTSKNKKIYNYRVCRDRRFVENAFGILVSRFRIFKTPINVEPNNIDRIVLASCALHNYLMSNSTNSYTYAECFDRENMKQGCITPGSTSNDSNMKHLDQRYLGNSPNAAKIVREKYVHYFNKMEACLVDRGFRDAIYDMKSARYVPFMPCCKGKRKQLTIEDTMNPEG